MKRKCKESNFPPPSLIDPQWLAEELSTPTVSEWGSPSLSEIRDSSFTQPSRISRYSQTSSYPGEESLGLRSLATPQTPVSPSSPKPEGLREPPTVACTWIEEIIEDSRLPGTNNGSRMTETPETREASGEIESVVNSKPNGDQKWLFAFLLALLFVILASPPAYGLSQKITRDFYQRTFATPPLWAVLLQGLIFLLLVRLILW